MQGSFSKASAKASFINDIPLPTGPLFNDEVGIRNIGTLQILEE